MYSKNCTLTSRSTGASRAYVEPRHVTVELTPEQEAAGYAVARQRMAEDKGFASTLLYGGDKGQFQHEADAANAEQALALWLRLPWTGRDRRFGPDVGEGLEARATRYAHGHLIMRAGDEPLHVYVLITINSPIYRLAVWVYGDEGKRRGKLRDDELRPEGVWWVPQEALRPMHSLPRALKLRPKQATDAAPTYKVAH